MWKWVLLVLVLSSPASVEAQGRTFGGYKCTLDCSGHSAGYEWAERRPPD